MYLFSFVTEAVLEKKTTCSIFDKMDEKIFKQTLSAALAYAKDWNGGRKGRLQNTTVDTETEEPETEEPENKEPENKESETDDKSADD